MPPFDFDMHTCFWGKINPDGSYESLYKKDREDVTMTEDEKTLKERTDKLAEILHEQGYITVGQFCRTMDVEYDEEDEDEVYFGDKGKKKLIDLLKRIKRLASYSDPAIITCPKICELCDEIKKLWDEKE